MMNGPSLVVATRFAHPRARVPRRVYLYLNWTNSLDGAHLFDFIADSKLFHDWIMIPFLFSMMDVGNHRASSGASLR